MIDPECLLDYVADVRVEIGHVGFAPRSGERVYLQQAMGRASIRPYLCSPYKLADFKN